MEMSQKKLQTAQEETIVESCCCSLKTIKKEELSAYNLPFKENFVYKPAERMAKYLNMSPENTETLIWYSNYAMNNLPTIVIKHFNIAPVLKALPFPVNHMHSGIIHMLIGANPRCDNDKELYTNKPSYYHALNFTAGMFGCFVAAQSYNYFRPFIAGFTNETDPTLPTSGANIITSLASLAFMTLLEGKIMCSIEKTVLKGFKQTGNLMGTVSHVGYSAIEYAKDSVSSMVSKTLDTGKGGWASMHNTLSKTTSWVNRIKENNELAHSKAM